MPVSNKSNSGKPELLLPERFEEYDSFVRAHDNGWVCTETVWSEILRECFPHISPCINIICDKSGSIRSAVPVYHVKSIFTGNRLVGTPFATHSDMLLSNVVDASLSGVILEELQNTTNSRYVELRSSFCRSQKLFPPGIGHYKTHKCHTIALEGSESTIYQKLHRTCVRKNITRAEKSNLTIRDASTVGDLSLFYRLYCNTRKKVLLPAMPYRFFNEIFKRLVPKKQALFLIAEQNSTPVASLMLLMYKSRASAEALGWNTAFLAVKPVVYIYWEAIKRALQEGYTLFDFGRTDPQNTSLMDFKSHWGATVTDLNTYRLNTHVKPDGLVKAGSGSNVSGFIRRVLFNTGTPDLLYGLLSGYIYRHMG